MQYLFDGVKDFFAHDYLEMKKLFHNIGQSQKPHTLFIGCSDSRIVPNLITKTLPGDLFVIRNIANLVPVYRASEEYLATTSAIEYAVKVLDIENIIVCGHSNCGGCKSIFMEEKDLVEIPHTRKWLELMGRVKAQVIEQLRYEHPLEKVDAKKHEAKRDLMTEQLNIVEQMNHLLTYPYIREKYEQKALNILGWYYIIESGEVFNYNADQQIFEKIT